jgi:hypothetical protein
MSSRTVPAEVFASMEAAGRAAYDADAPAAPAASAAVLAAIDDMPVGTGAADIMGAFSRGYDARASEVATAALAEPPADGEWRVVV